LPFLSADAPRLTGASRERYARGVVVLTEAVADLLRRMDDPQPEVTAASVLSEMVGAVSLARAEPDPDRSYAILKASRDSLRARLGLEGLE
jgi:TetR/AcrR family transcriptional repressor of nem operon